MRQVTPLLRSWLLEYWGDDLDVRSIEGTPDGIYVLGVDPNGKTVRVHIPDETWSQITGIRSTGSIETKRSAHLIPAVAFSVGMSQKENTDEPSQSALFALAWFVPAELRDSIVGDAEERFHADTERFGARKAAALLWWDVVRTASRTILEGPFIRMITIIRRALIGH